MLRRLVTGAGLLAVSLLVLGGPAMVAWPEKPVKVVVPFGPGGSTDVFTRLIQKVAQEQGFPQPITVINVGGHFSVGATQVKNAAADGYTFLIAHPALLIGEVVDPARKLSYRDFEPVALTGGFCLVNVVRDDSPYKTFADLAAAAKEKPGQIVFGVNVGGLNHTGGGLLARAAGVKFRFVQIGGGSENYAALKGGQTQSTMLSSSEYQNFKSGGIRGLVYTGPERMALEPSIPTAMELGLGFEFCINNFWFAPKGTPKEAIEGMQALLRKVMASPEVAAAQAKQASTTDFLAGEAFRRKLDATFAALKPVAEELVRK